MYRSQWCTLQGFFWWAIPQLIQWYMLFLNKISEGSSISRLPSLKGTICKCKNWGRKPDLLDSRCITNQPSSNTVMWTIQSGCYPNRSYSLPRVFFSVLSWFLWCASFHIKSVSTKHWNRKIKEQRDKKCSISNSNKRTRVWNSRNRISWRITWNGKRRFIVFMLFTWCSIIKVIHACQ